MVKLFFLNKDKNRLKAFLLLRFHVFIKHECENTFLFRYNEVYLEFFDSEFGFFLIFKTTLEKFCFIDSLHKKKLFKSEFTKMFFIHCYFESILISYTNSNKTL